MSLTYTWKVTGIKTRDEVNEQGETLQNAVVQTYWQKIGTDADGNGKGCTSNSHQAGGSSAQYAHA